MIALLWYQQIIAGKKQYSQVPTKLKPKVRQLLIDNQYEYLITE